MFGTKYLSMRTAIARVRTSAGMSPGLRFPSNECTSTPSQTSIAVYSSPSDRTPEHQGWNSDQFHPVELWSKGTNTLSECTAAYGLVSVQQADNYTAYTGKRC